MFLNRIRSGGDPCSSYAACFGWWFLGGGGSSAVPKLWERIRVLASSGVFVSSVFTSALCGVFSSCHRLKPRFGDDVVLEQRASGISPPHNFVSGLLTLFGDVSPVKINVVVSSQSNFSGAIRGIYSFGEAMLEFHV
ncbi:hypothetical protein Bca101_032221 [Brassica carinata]